MAARQTNNNQVRTFGDVFGSQKVLNSMKRKDEKEDEGDNS